MKKLLIFAFLVVGFAMKAQEPQPYQPWSTFGGDTLRYLKTNFDDNKARYIGYPFEKAINDYELTLNGVNIFWEIWDNYNCNMVTGATLKYVTIGQSMTLGMLGKTEHVVRVTFQTPTCYEYPPSYAPGEWLPDQNARAVAGRMKDLIIGNIKVETFP